MNFRKTFIIAEAGVNHNGNLKMAKELVRQAKKAGASAVKFQTFIANKSISKFAKKAKYQIISTLENNSQLEMCKPLELSRKEHEKLLIECKKNKIEFMSTPFDFDSIKLLLSLKIKKIKVASSELNNYPFLEEIAKTKKDIILSTGMGSLKEIKEALRIFKKQGVKKDKITILHCNTEYPTPFKDANLNAILTIKKTFNVKVGYSDHTLGIEAPIAAVALGAEVIEKHFTLNKNLNGPDHKASIEPYEFKKMVESIRNIELGMGDGIKKPSQSEIANILVARKSIVANNYIKKNEIFTKKNLAIKRPGTGISPIYFKKLLGLKSDRDYVEDEIIKIKKYK